MSRLCSALRIDLCCCFFFFFFNDTATTEIYTLSLHDALPIRCPRTSSCRRRTARRSPTTRSARHARRRADRKSTRLNSSHVRISYAVFCLKKKKTNSFFFSFKKKKKPIKQT